LATLQPIGDKNVDTSLLNYALMGVVIAGVTEMLNRARARDWWVVATIASAGIIGALFGWAQIDGLTSAVQGLATGFGTSGFISVAHAFGSAKSTPAPSAVIDTTGQ
jgi:hypothetical protein